MNKLKKIMLSIIAILLVFSGLNVSAAEKQNGYNNPEIHRILPDGSKTKDSGTVTKGEDIKLGLYYPEAIDKTMIIPLGDSFTYDEIKMKELLKDQQDIEIIYQKEKRELEISWKTKGKEAIVFSLNAIKTGNADIKAVQIQGEIESNILKVKIQDNKTSKEKLDSEEKTVA
ncbi:hypothetical protein CN324_13685, partial [Bacillus anthracis]